VAAGHAYGGVEGALGRGVIAEFSRRPTDGSQRHHARAPVARQLGSFGNADGLLAVARRIGEHALPCRLGLPFQFAHYRGY
jgi:hypothetical protein